MKEGLYLYKEEFLEIFAISQFLKNKRNFGKPELRKSILILIEERSLNANILTLVAVANGKI